MSFALATVETIDPGVLTNEDAVRAGFADLAALLDMLGPQDGNPVYRITLKGIEADERVALRTLDELSDADWPALEAQFRRWDRTRPGYFLSILKAIADRPGIAAGALAADAGVEKAQVQTGCAQIEGTGPDREPGRRLPDLAAWQGGVGEA